MQTLERPTSYPDWLDALFLRFTAIYQGKWTYAIQDPRVFALTQFEWWETLREFEPKVIMETVSAMKRGDNRRNRDDFPSIQQFYEVAKAKQDYIKSRQQMIENAEQFRNEKNRFFNKPASNGEEVQINIRNLMEKVKINSARFKK